MAVIPAVSGVVASGVLVYPVIFISLYESEFLGIERGCATT
jgi:hypothetical protein